MLNLVSGVFGKWFEDFIHRYGGETIELAVAYNEAIDPQAVRDALNANPGVKYLSVVHSETPSGTINPLKEIGAVAKEFGVLRMLLNAKGRVLTRGVLQETVWKHAGLDSRTVDVHIGRLRRKLGPAGNYVLTVRGVGYRFSVMPELVERNVG